LGKDSYRSRSVESVVDEIERLGRRVCGGPLSLTKYPFLSKPPNMQARAPEFADEMLRRRVDVTFMIDARMDSVQDFSLYDKMYAAGLRRVFIGIETGSPAQLIAYRKRSVRAGEDAGGKMRALRGDR